ncbi:MAG: MlaE family ABC transporter permease [Luteibaculaceae bacterium]
MIKLLYHIGRYFNLIWLSLKKPENFGVFRTRLSEELESIGLKSVGIVALLSAFMGAVIVLQTASNIDSPLLPLYTVGFTARQSIILEFAPTIISLILAGKVGSNIASELGTMRVTEQIDALEIMGINSASFLILPKILAAVIIFPFIIALAMGIGISGGAVVSITSDVLSLDDYIYGLQFDFKTFSVVYALIKAVFFGFIITSVSSYHGYYTKGGALEVGRSSTQAVVYSNIVILLVNYLLTQLLLI